MILHHYVGFNPCPQLIIAPHTQMKFVSINNQLQKVRKSNNTPSPKTKYAILSLYAEDMTKF